MKMNMNFDVSIIDGNLVLTDKEGGIITFSKEQSLQKKVSMITLGELSDLPKQQIANAFGYSTRKSYYDIRDAVLNGSAEDLIPGKTGPKTAAKRTKELEIMVIKMRFETDYNMYEIAEDLKSKGIVVGARVIGQILSDYGLAKKNLSKGEKNNPRLLELMEHVTKEGICHKARDYTRSNRRTKAWLDINEHRKHEVSKKDSISGDDIEKLLSLPDAVPELWKNGGIAIRDKKRMLRCLVKDVTLTKTGKNIDVSICFSGGATCVVQCRTPLNF